jgi:hypothetical protein
MAGMIKPRRFIITTLSFLSGFKSDLDHSPAQRGRHSNGARTEWSAVQVARVLQRIDQLAALETLPDRRHFRFEGKAEVTRAAPNRRERPGTDLRNIRARLDLAPREKKMSQ